jgi:hypothetical protein
MQVLKRIISSDWIYKVKLSGVLLDKVLLDNFFATTEGGR